MRSPYGGDADPTPAGGATGNRSEYQKVMNRYL